MLLDERIQSYLLSSNINFLKKNISKCLVIMFLYQNWSSMLNLNMSLLTFQRSISYPTGLSESEPTPKQDDHSPRDFLGRFLPGQQRCVAIAICNKRYCSCIENGYWYLKQFIGKSRLKKNALRIFSSKPG